MAQAIKAYNEIRVAPEFLEAQRLREKAEHDEASARRYEREKGRAEERKVWQGVAAENERLRAARMRRMSGCVLSLRNSKQSTSKHHTLEVPCIEQAVGANGKITPGNR